MIARIPYEDIDKSAYDQCVANSENFRIYATSCYLDAVAGRWEALVYKDYQAVMPVPCRKKYGLRYAFTPTFIQQLGVFSSNVMAKDLERTFYKRLSSKFVLVDYAVHSGSHPNPKWTERVNLVLDLNPAYENLFESFNTNRKRILKKGFDHLVLNESYDPDLFMEQLQRTDLGFVPGADLRLSLKRLMEQCPEMVRTWQVYEDSEWVGGLAWLKDEKRITYLLPVSTEKGQALDAGTFLLDALIQAHQGKNLLLDLEGSMIPGVARFYRSFGAQQETYYFMKSRCYGLF